MTFSCYEIDCCKKSTQFFFDFLSLKKKLTGGVPIMMEKPKIFSKTLTIFLKQGKEISVKIKKRKADSFRNFFALFYLKINC